MAAPHDGTATPAIDHQPPSFPASPDRKRVKSIDPQHPLDSVAGIIQAREASNTTPTPTSLPHHLPPVMAFPEIALEVKLLSERGRAPTKGSALAAGYDIYSAHEITIPARSKALVDTDIAIAIPAGAYGRIAPRSGLAAKHSIDCGAGVIDADYRGPLKVLLFNFSDDDFAVKEGDRIAQLILELIVTPAVVVVSELSETARGVGGFGSTGGFGSAVSSAVGGAVMNGNA